MKKTGRKQVDHRDSRTGLPVVGLSRMTDGRWRIIGTQIRFTEENEAAAIEKFRKLKDPIEHSDLSAEDKAWLRTPASVIIESTAATEIQRGFALIGDPDPLA